jgi:hypothetical protein
MKEVVVVSKFEAELSRHLRPVSAPDRLWEKIEGAGGAERPARAPWPLWAFAAAALAALTLFCLSLRSDPTPYLATLAAQQLAANARPIEFHSGDAAEIQRWAKRYAGLDIPLAGGRGIQLLGASVIRNGALSLCVSYRVGDHAGKLLVTRGSSGAAEHAAMQTAFQRGAALVSWTAEGQTYALAAPDVRALRAACVMCHANGTEKKRSPRA